MPRPLPSPQAATAMICRSLGCAVASNRFLTAVTRCSGKPMPTKPATYSSNRWTFLLGFLIQSSPGGSVLVQRSGADVAAVCRAGDGTYAGTHDRGVRTVITALSGISATAASAVAVFCSRRLAAALQSCSSSCEAEPVAEVRCCCKTSRRRC